MLAYLYTRIRNVNRAATAILVLSVISIYVACKPKNPTNSYENNRNVNGVSVLALNHNPASETDKDGPQKESPCWNISAENALAFVAVLTFIAILYQASVMAKSVRVQESQIRPWLILSKDTTLPAAPPDDWKFIAVVKNYGKTPARITSLRVESQVGTDANVPPDTSIYEGATAHHSFLLPPKEAETWDIRLPKPWAAKDVIPEKQFLWLCGFIQYCDASARFHATTYETSFCLRYMNASGIRKAGWESWLSKYNRTT